MIVEGEYTFAGTPDTIWPMLLDPQVIARTMPGTERMVRVGPERYEGTMRVGIGSITAAEFEVAVTLADVVAPERYTMRIDGRGKFGFTRGEARVRLEPSATGTVLHFLADMQVGGKVAAVGQRLLDSIGKLMTRQGLEGLAREVNQRLGLGAGGQGQGAGPA
jgi:uncharacterized protein